MTSKLVTTLAAFVFAGGLASAARAADTGPGVPPPPAQGPATTGNDAMMGGAGKPGPQDHGMAAGGQMCGGKMGGGMMPMPDMMNMMAMMNAQKPDAPEVERMGMMLQTNMMLEMNMMMQINMMRMMNTMMGEMRHGGEHHGMMDGTDKAPMMTPKPQGALPGEGHGGTMDGTGKAPPASPTPQGTVPPG